MVQEAIANQQLCICVFPGDTTNDKQGMLPGQDLTYDANFKSAYELYTLNSSLLTDGILFSRTGTPYSEIYSQGENFTIVLNASTTLQAIRLFNKASDDAVVTFTNDAGGEACPQLEDFDSILNVLDWDTQFCGAEYSCKNFRTETDYSVNCGVDINAPACLTWKEATCTAQAGA